MTTPRLRPASILIATLLACLALAARVRAGDDTPPADEKERAAALIEAFKSTDLQARIQAVEDAAGNQHESLTPALLHLLPDRETGVRFAAIQALGARESESDRKRAAPALAARLGKLGKHPADREELMLSIEALRTLRQPSTIKALLDGIDLDTEVEVVEARLFAVAHVPHADAVEALIDFLAKGRRGGREKQRGLAHKALRFLTGQKDMEEHATAGHDADRWRAWWKDNKKTLDLEAVAAAREEAAAAKEAKAEEQKRRAEERKKKRDEAQKKKAEGKKEKKDGAGDGAAPQD